MEMAKNAKVNVWVKENKQLYVIENIIRTFLIEEIALGFRWCFLMWSLLLFFFHWFLSSWGGLSAAIEMRIFSSVKIWNQGNFSFLYGFLFVSFVSFFLSAFVFQKTLFAKQMGRMIHQCRLIVNSWELPLK